MGAVRRGGGRSRPLFAVVALAALAGSCGGCTFFPAQGPGIVHAAADDPDRVPYLLVDLTPRVLARLGETREPSLRQVFGDERPPPEIRLGIGDVVGVTIFEAAAGGLFIPQEAGSRAGNFVALPSQEVDQGGMIAVPYAGEVPAAGHTLPQVKRTIEERLRNRAIEPQAVVTLVDGRSTQVSVTGEVNASTRFALARSGERVLDAIARAGGSKYQAYETFVTLKRGGRAAKTELGAIIANGASNIYLRPGDTVVLNREFRSFMALGASGQNGRIPFDSETLTLAQASGRAGGVLDARGDPAQVYLFRLEARGAVAGLGYDLAPHPGPRVPVIYRVDMRAADGFFLASGFPMRDGDILYVANSGASDLSKLLGLVGLGAGSASDMGALRLALR